MKKILIALLAIVMITGCSTSKKTQTLFVEKNKKYVKIKNIKIKRRNYVFIY